LAHLRRAVDEGTAMMAGWERERALGLGPAVVRRVEPIRRAGYGQGQDPGRVAAVPAHLRPSAVTPPLRAREGQLPGPLRRDGSPAGFQRQPDPVRQGLEGPVRIPRPAQPAKKQEGWNSRERWFAPEGRRGGVHDYVTQNTVCRDAAAASPAQRADQLSRFAYPGQDPERPARHNSENLVWDRRGPLPVPGGVVRTRISPDGQAVQNRTTRWHVFDGTVDRRFVEVDGRLDVRSQGVGDSPMLFFDSINQREGARLMHHMDRAMARSMAKKIPGC
jgi:hypothetical protein